MSNIHIITKVVVEPMGQEVALLDDAESFWPHHSYLARVWEERDRRGKKVPRNPFNYSFNPTPFFIYFEYTQGKDPDYQVIFNDPLRQDFFREIEQFHRSLSFSWEQSGYTRAGTFTDQIKVFHEFFENAAAQVWKTIETNYGLAPLEILARLFPLFSLLSNQIYLISDFCLKVGIPAQNYCEYYTVFNEILRKGHDIFQMALGEKDLVETLLELNKQLIIYTIMLGFPYFQWQESRGWCPEELAGVLEEENALVMHEGKALEEIINPRHMNKIEEWFERNRSTAIVMPLVPPNATLGEAVVIENIRVFLQAFKITSVGSMREKLQQKFNLPPNQANILVYRLQQEEEFAKMMGDKKPQAYVPPPPAPQVPAAGSPQAPMMKVAPPSDKFADFSRKLEEYTRHLTPANVLDPPALNEIELVLQILRYPLKKAEQGGVA